jgi:hypothetical protein
MEFDTSKSSLRSFLDRPFFRSSATGAALLLAACGISPAQNIDKGTSKNCRGRLMPRKCRRMIPLCSRFDSLAFTALPVSISTEIDFSRSPQCERPRQLRMAAKNT